jgi:hypothetical protein
MCDPRIMTPSSVLKPSGHETGDGRDEWSRFLDGEDLSVGTDAVA